MPRSFAEIHARNPYLSLLDGDPPPTVVRAVFAYTERREAVEQAKAALAGAGEAFKETHQKAYEELETHRLQHSWHEVKRIEDKLLPMWKFRLAWLSAEIDEKTLRLWEIRRLLQQFKHQGAKNFD